MSEHMKDSGHRTMRTCDSCDGAFYCAQPGREKDPEDMEAPGWTCETCTKKDAEIARLRAALKALGEEV